MKKNKKIKLKIIFAYALGIAIASFIFYLVIPVLLNYGPGTINTQFDKEVSGGLYYYQQILIFASALIMVVSLFLGIILKDIDYYPIYMNNKIKYKKNIEHIRKICLNLPNRLLIIFITVPLILTIGVLFMQTTFLTPSDFKLMLVIFILSTITISLTNLYTKRILSKILNDLENTSFSKVRRTGITERLLLQIIPIIAVCIIFTYLAVLSIYERNNAELLASFYINQFKTELKHNEVTNEEELKRILQNITLSRQDNVLFITDENNNFIYQTGNLSDFFKKYTVELAKQNNNIIYDYYGTSGQGILYEISLKNGEKYYLGAAYTIYEGDVLVYITALLLGLGVICSIIIYTFARELSKNIEEVTNSLEEISKDDNGSFAEKKLYITSVDEIGDLIKVYNKIQLLTINHLNQIHDNQETLMERERLASLGQLIGGIAHNLKTPIMSISGATEGLKDLIEEYDQSIGDKEVTNEDHHEIAKDMKTWVDKIKTHTEYMSDVITVVKGQAVNLSTDDESTFTVDELLKRVNILMKHELKNAIVYLNVQLKTEGDLTIHGDVNSLVQVINNMISNSIQAYDGKKDQNIDLIVEKDDNNLLISVKDYGPGLSKKVQNKLFKEMITTKGKNGTGLGLYMSYSTIRAHFNGNIFVESKQGEGSTFIITIPL